MSGQVEYTRFDKFKDEIARTFRNVGIDFREPVRLHLRTVHRREIAVYTGAVQRIKKRITHDHQATESAACVSRTVIGVGPKLSGLIKDVLALGTFPGHVQKQALFGGCRKQRQKIGLATTEGFLFH